MAKTVQILLGDPVDKEPEVISKDEIEASENEEYEESEETKKVYGPFTMPGMLVGAKNMYQGPKDDEGKRAWVEDLPSDLDEPAENASTAQNALLIRNVKCYDGRRQLSIHSIVVQSPLIRQALGRILENYPGIQTKLERLTFEAPFEPFVHRWSKFIQVREESEGAERKHLDLLYDILEKELENVLKARADLIANQVIDFPNVWMIFEPGSVLYSSQLGQPIATKLGSGKYTEDCNGNKIYGLRSKYVDWDGDQFGWTQMSQKVSEFSGTVNISELPVIPIQYCANETFTRAMLVERGKQWEQFAGYHFQAYKGMARGRNPQDHEWMSFSVDSRIIIDTRGWNRFEPNDAVGVTSFRQSIIEDERLLVQNEDDEDDADNGSECGSDNNSEWRDHNDEIFDVDDRLDDDQFKSRTPTPLDEEQLLLASPTIKGYSLKDRKWLILMLSGVRPIKFSDTAFSSLVLDQQQKDLILALSTAQRSHKKSFDDVIQGKGRGMIMLLAGAPGVGKTLTGESVAENLRCPLYTVGAADLGTYPWEVENKLQNVLEMCARWNAVCLIDEADVFLEARSTSDLERNKLVSIFLRTLEYYEGILFLTTNRVDNIDAAFHSRIHLSLSYPDLTPESRRKVWQNFIDAAAKFAAKNDADKAPCLTEEDISKLAAFNMNGREIKNVLKTAQLVASMKDEALSFEHVRTVMNVEQRYHGRQDALRI